MTAATTQASTMLRWALRYAERGLRVFPLGVKAKEPLFPNAHPNGDPLRGVCKGSCGKDGHGLLDATTDPEKILRWWSRHPNANIGIRVPDNMLVLDFDSIEALSTLLLSGRALPNSWTVKTANGLHFWFKTSEPLRQLRPFPDVDVRTSDGYVVAPPSVHPTGAIYTWEDPSPKEMPEPAAAPEWLVNHLKQLEKPEATASSSPAGGEPIVEKVFSGLQVGERDDAMFRYACRLRGMNVDRREAELLVLAAYDRAAKGDFDSNQAIKCLDSAWRYAPGRAAKEAIRGEQVASADDPDLMPIEQLMATDFPPTRWIVPNLLSEGFVVLAASPKIGKSWFTLNLALAISAGNKIMGRYPTERGQVLYIDLEQPRKKTQERIRKLSFDGYNNPRFPPGGWSGVTFASRWPRMDEGGLEKLSDWLRENPSTRMVVIDVLSKVTPKAKRHGNVYDEEYRLYGDMKRVFDEHGVAGVCVHHDRKGGEGDQVDRVSGSRALVGAADTVLVLTRKRGQKSGYMFATGREIEDRTLELEFRADLCEWVFVAEVEADFGDAGDNGFRS